MKTITIADDHAIVRDGLTNFLSMHKQYQVIASVDSAEGLIRQCQQELADIVITDLSMPGMGGIEGIRRLKVKWPKAKIIVFSISQNSCLVKRLLDLGIEAYISKSCETSVILNGISTVSQGKKFISPDIDLLFNHSQPSQLQKLTAREFDIFCAITDGKTIKQVAEKLFLSEKTIANNLSLVKRKLGVSTYSELIHIAIAAGILVTDY